AGDSRPRPPDSLAAAPPFPSCLGLLPRPENPGPIFPAGPAPAEDSRPQWLYPPAGRPRAPSHSNSRRHPRSSEPTFPAGLGPPNKTRAQDPTGGGHSWILPPRATPPRPPRGASIPLDPLSPLAQIASGLLPSSGS